MRRSGGTRENKTLPGTMCSCCKIFRAALLLLGPIAPNLNHLFVSASAFSRMETAEIGFARDRLIREAGGQKTDADSIRKAYRRLALRINQNLYGKNAQLEMQMRMLNLAKDALMKGEKIGSEDDFADSRSEEHVEEGRQLSAGKRLSEDIYKSMKGWQEEAIENSIRFDDPDEVFEGNTQMAFDDALNEVLLEETHPANRLVWSSVHAQNATLSASSKRVIHRRMHLALQACGVKDAALEADSLLEMARALEEIASVQWDGRSYTCPTVDEETGDAGSSSTRRSRPCSPCGKIIAGDTSTKSRLFSFARELKSIARSEELELLERARKEGNPDAAKQLEAILAAEGGGGGVDVAQLEESIQLTEVQMSDPHCKQRNQNTYGLLSDRFNEFQYSKVVDAAFPLDPCALVGLEQFVREKLATHAQTKANFTEAADVDRKLVQGLSGLLGIQQAKYNAPIGVRAFKSKMAAKNKKKSKRKWRTAAQDDEPSYKTKRRRSREQAEKEKRDKVAKERALIPREKQEKKEEKEFEHKRHRTCLSKKRAEARDAAKTPQVRDAEKKNAASPLMWSLKQLEEMLWQGAGFPELHESAAKAIAELSETLQLQRILVEENTETLETLEPLHDPPTTPVFPHLSFPGLALRPYMSYETGMIREWGDEWNQFNETEWDPVKIGLGYLDLVPYCDMQSQVVGSFLQAGFWFYKALQNLDEHCGNDDWQQDFLIPELLQASAEMRQVAMIYALKKASLEMLDTAMQIAAHLVAPNVRFVLMRTALRVRTSLLRNYGQLGDVEKLVKQFVAFRNLQQFFPVWHPPAILIGDMLFADVLTGRLQEAFLSSVMALDPIVAPLSKKELLFAKYEADLLQHSFDFDASRYDAMEAALVMEDGEKSSTVEDGNLLNQVATTSSVESGFAIMEETMRPKFLANYFDNNGFFSVLENESRLDKQKRRRSAAERQAGSSFFVEITEVGDTVSDASTSTGGENAETTEGETVLVEEMEEEVGQEVKDSTSTSAGTVAGGSSTTADDQEIDEVSKRYLASYRLVDTFLEDGNSFSHIEGMEFDTETGHLYLLGGHSSDLSQEPLLDAEDIAMLLTTVVPGEPAFATVDPIAPFHVFQKLNTNMKDLLKPRQVAGTADANDQPVMKIKRTKVEQTLTFLAFLLQQIAAQVEISAFAPFQQRVSRLGLEVNKVEVGEPWEVPRVWLECSQVEYTQSISFDGRLRFTLKDQVEIQINDGEKLEPLQIENWSLGKLKETIRFLEKRNYDPNVHIPRFDFGLVVDKQELVDSVRELIKRNPDVFLEEEGEVHPLKRFGRRMTHAYRHKLRHWPLFQRFEEMCKLKALSSILDSRRHQVRVEAEHADAKAQLQAEQVLKQKWAQWEEILSETRYELMKTELQVQDFDPGRCWNGQQYTFHKCCNGVGQGDPFGVHEAGAGKGAGAGSTATPAIGGTNECFDGSSYTYERCCPMPKEFVKRDTIRALAQQLAQMTTKDPAPDLHALTNRLDEYLKQPFKVHSLRKVVLLLYEGEDPLEVKARLVKQYLRVYEQMEKDMDLLKQKLHSLVDVEANAKTSAVSSELAAKQNVTAHADLLPAISTPKKIYSGVSLGPEMVPATFKNKRAFDRVSFSSILKTKESFQHYHKENLITLEMEKLAFGTTSNALASKEQAETSKSGPPACAQEWIQKRPADLELVAQPGDPIRVVNTQGAEQGLFVESLTVSANAKGPLRRLIALQIEGSTKYFDATSEWDVYVKQTLECSEEEDLTLWPKCVHQNKYVKGQGIFLNLAHFGIQKGCFQDDCSHSDHFASESAALCAEVCRLIPACKFWSVTVGVEFTCWLKGSRDSLLDKPGALAADATCHPPAEETTVKKKALAPTLFETLRGKSLRFPKASEVLSVFGHKTREEIVDGPKTPLQKIALGVMANV
ncbi:unnamed protein product [Amoebophrya sp. A120]|nr:unnamed protein product [Amoebophrya sp. A120]|eukprot:GSA120T00003754001.1